MSLTARAVMIAVLACTLVAACEDKPASEAPSGSTAAPSKPAAAEAKLPPQMVAAVSAGRSASIIDVHFALKMAPAVGKPLIIDIAVVPHEAFDSVGVMFEAPEALAMGAGSRIAPREDVKAESILEHQLQVQPSEEGVFLITAAVETHSEEGNVIRIFHIPVIVNAVTPAPSSSAPAPAPAAAAGG
jgi:hypothetical protein